MPEIKVNGMNCEHCRASVTKALSALPGIAEVRVDLSRELAAWRDQDPARPVDPEKVKEAVRRAGFDA
ncbi:MAG: heavy-metal-associated domain-containing protein [Desulfovibrionaceae bacterium]|nr:heavy-metal-associated domain-containing protein [Desulfovibrionaceae bacterium]